ATKSIHRTHKKAQVYEIFKQYEEKLTAIKLMTLPLGEGFDSPSSFYGQHSHSLPGVRRGVFLERWGVGENGLRWCKMLEKSPPFPHADCDRLFCPRPVYSG
ncbi:hypothetical protein, partial [Evtepia sp.]|uniref:hypothetical protein n=1 Tax=Evtepia sp. TaxID=2773933 RepID=UPI002E79262C